MMQDFIFWRLFFKNSNWTKCNDVLGLRACVPERGWESELGPHLWTFELRPESFRILYTQIAPSSSLLPWPGAAGVPAGPGLPSIGPLAVLGPTKTASLHVY